MPKRGIGLWAAAVGHGAAIVGHGAAIVYVQLCLAEIKVTFITQLCAVTFSE